MRGYHCPPPAAKSAKTEAIVSFLNLSFVPPTHQIFHHFIFQINCYSQINRRIHRRSPATALPLFNTPATPLQAGDGELVCGFYLPQSHFFSLESFSIKLYSVNCAARFPSVHTANKSPLARRVENAATVSSSLLFIPPYSNLFLTASFSNHIAIPNTAPAALPQSIKGTRSCHDLLTPPVAWRIDDGEFPFVFIVFPIQNFSHIIFSRNFYSAMPAALPQSIKGTRPHRQHPRAACCMEKVVTVSFPLVFLMLPHHSNFFLAAFFPVKLLFCWPGQLPSLSNQGNIACHYIPVGKLCGEGGDGEFSSCSYFSLPFQIFSHC